MAIIFIPVWSGIKLVYSVLQANFAKWEPWHGKFGFSYPWEKYLKIGEVLRELAAFILVAERCLQASKQVVIFYGHFMWLLNDKKNIKKRDLMGSFI